MADEPKPARTNRDAPIEELLGQIVADARDLAQAEVALAKAKAESELRAYKAPLVLLVLAALFFASAITTLCVVLALALATLLGPLGGGLVATMIALAVAGLLALVAKSKLEKIG